MKQINALEILSDPSFLKSLSKEQLKEIEKGLEEIKDSKNIEQHALKILINALYGAQANKYFILANPDLAAGITSTGRFFIRLCAMRVEQRLQSLLKSEKPYVVAGDTDSFYYHLETFTVKKFGPEVDYRASEVIDWLDEFEKKIIQPTIDEAIEEFSDILNIYDPKKIGVEREIIADSAVFVAKKKYFARVADMEGVRYTEGNPYIKIMGLETARSSTPPWCRTKLKESINVMLDQDLKGIRVWRDKAMVEFKEQPLDQISMTSGISSLDYDLNDKGIPQGPRSALIHNKFLENNGLIGEVDTLKPGEKYKRCYLLQPNRFGSEIISYGDNKILKIIESDGIFDYATNFQKYFEAPLENMVGSIGYNIESKFFLDDDF